MFSNLYQFVPNIHLNDIDNKNAMIKFCIYLNIIILLVTQKWKIVIIISIIMITIEIIGNILININRSNLDTKDKIINRCRKSTINNPMGNPLLYTKQEDLDISFCKDDNNVSSNLRYNVYNDEKDLFLKKKNNMREFITMPSQTHPNNFNAYKDYIYYFDNPTCKTDNINCMYYEDIRYHKN